MGWGGFHDTGGVQAAGGNRSKWDWAEVTCRSGGGNSSAVGRAASMQQERPEWYPETGWKKVQWTDLASSGISPSLLPQASEFTECWARCSVSSVQLLSHVRLFATPWTAARQASLSITNSQNLLKLMCIESVMPSNHLILCHPLLLPPSIFPSIRVFSDESALQIKWPKYWEFQLQHQSFKWTPRTDLL